MTCRPAPTARASRPSRIEPAISVIATLTRSGTTNPSPAGVAILSFWYFLVTAVPCLKWCLADAQPLPHGRHRAGGRPPKFYERRGNPPRGETGGGGKV